jgi:hypothetical protein
MVPAPTMPTSLMLMLLSPVEVALILRAVGAAK